MTEATNSDLNILMAFLVLAPVVVIAVIVIIIKAVGNSNDRKR